MDDPVSTFELTGRFGGWVRTDAGKRRLLLHQDEHTFLLKVPRLLRRNVIGKYHAGQIIHVAGTEEKSPGADVPKRTVSRLWTDSVGPAASCPVQVCSKKNCWRKGGRELWDALCRERDVRGLAGQVELRQVDCLDRCKHAPNADWGDHEFSHCSPGDAAAIIARAVPVNHPSTHDLPVSPNPA